MLVLSISLLPAGIVPTTLAADVEGDIATVVLEMPDGATAPRTYEVAQELEAAGTGSSNDSRAAGPGTRHRC